MVNYDVNVLGAAVAAVISMAVGFLWYGPVFGKMWMELSGKGKMTKAHQEAMKKKMLPLMIMGLVAQFITAALISVLVLNLGITAVADAVTVAVIAWVIAQTVVFGEVLWSGRKVALFAFDAAYRLISFAVMGAAVVLL